MRSLNIEFKYCFVDAKMKSVLDFLAKYAGASSRLILSRQLAKAGVSDLSSASDLQLMAVCDGICGDVLSHFVSRGRLPIVRSELISVLGMGTYSSGIPLEVDNVRVLPDGVEEMMAEYFASSEEFVLKQELVKYGLTDLSLADSRVRMKILEAFVEYYFGYAGRAILDGKIDELGIWDVLDCPQYRRLVLMEYVLQSMLFFYVNPMKGRLLRSELVSVLEIDLGLLQYDVPDSESVRAAQEVSSGLCSVPLDASRRVRLEYEDLFAFIVKRELSSLRVSDIAVAPQDVKLKVLRSILAAAFGSMAGGLMSKLIVTDERIVGRFMMKLLSNQLSRVMLPVDAECLHDKVCSMVAVEA